MTINNIINNGTGSADRNSNTQVREKKGRADRFLRFLAIATCVQFGFTTGAAATPVISEIFYDAVGSDNGQSFVEIYGIAGTDLGGLTLEGVNGANGAVGPIVSLSGLIPADGIFVVADTDGAGTSVPGADLLANFDFQNGPDSIVLMNGVTVIDAVGYGVFGTGEVFAGEGSSAIDGPAGSSLARLFANIDSGDNSLDFVVLATPTPGSVLLQPVPEPGSALLMMLGLIGMGARRRTKGECRARQHLGRVG